MNEFIYYLEQKLPFMCTPKHLVEFGIFYTEQAACNARRKKTGPPFLKINKSIRYPKPDLLKYLQEQYQSCPKENLSI